MVDNQAGSNDLLDTTDCLEAVGVFKGWKNLLFLILVVCLLLLQAGFFLVDRGFVKIDGVTYVEEPEVQPEPEAPAESAAAPLTGWRKVSRVARNIGLFLAAPFIALGYIIALPAVGFYMFAKLGYEAYQKKRAAK